MRLSIDAARKSVGEDERVHPRVGVVVVKEGRILATSYRGVSPGAHAEFTVLDGILADEIVAGATVYTTLEPCTTRSHPKVPCAQRLIDRKVARVMIGMLDPNPEISGQGYRLLRGANVVTEMYPNPFDADVEDLNRDFIRSHRANTAATEISEGWLERELIAAGFDESAVLEGVGAFVGYLRDRNILNREAARRFLCCTRCREDLQKIYCEELRNPDRIVDPSGYCWWGSRLHAAHDGTREAVLMHLRSDIRRFLDKETGREVTPEAYARRAIRHHQAVLTAEGTPPVLEVALNGGRGREVSITVRNTGGSAVVTATSEIRAPGRFFGRREIKKPYRLCWADSGSAEMRLETDAHGTLVVARNSYPRREEYRELTDLGFALIHFPGEDELQESTLPPEQIRLVGWNPDRPDDHLDVDLAIELESVPAATRAISIRIRVRAREHGDISMELSD